jgi:uncharacterized protein YhbP (UPF0306 family)
VGDVWITACAGMTEKKRSFAVVLVYLNKNFLFPSNSVNNLKIYLHGKAVFLRNKIMLEYTEIKRLALEFIDQQSTMAIATAKENTAWIAPVYYIFYKSSFFFFSNPSSRHIREGINNKESSASIYPFVHDWQEIKGVQMSGCIHAVKPSFEAIHIIQAYIEKFPFTKNFFESKEKVSLENIAKKFRARLYRFYPCLVLYLDNQIQFGFRSEINIM